MNTPIYWSSLNLVVWWCCFSETELENQLLPRVFSTHHLHYSCQHPGSRKQFAWQPVRVWLSMCFQCKCWWLHRGLWAAILKPRSSAVLCGGESTTMACCFAGSQISIPCYSNHNVSGPTRQYNLPDRQCLPNLNLVHRLQQNYCWLYAPLSGTSRNLDMGVTRMKGSVRATYTMWGPLKGCTMENRIEGCLYTRARVESLNLILGFDKHSSLAQNIESFTDIKALNSLSKCKVAMLKVRYEEGSVTI